MALKTFVQIPLGVTASDEFLDLSAYAASHRAVREMKADGELPCRVQVRSSQYLNNLIKQYHRRVKQRIWSMLGFKRFGNAVVTISGIGLAEKIKKGQFRDGQAGPAQRDFDGTVEGGTRSLNPIAIPQRGKAEPISPAAWFAQKPARATFSCSSVAKNRRTAMAVEYVAETGWVGY